MADTGAKNLNRRRARRRLDINKEIGEIDPFILEKKNAWGDIYDNEAITQESKLRLFPLDNGNQIQEYIHRVRQNFTPLEINLLASVWYESALHGTHAIYPETSRQLYYYQLLCDTWTKRLILIASVIEIVCPFIEQPFCDYETILSQNSLFSDGYPSRLGLTLISFFMINIQILLDPILQLLASDFSKLNARFGHFNIDRSQNWNRFRCLILACQWLDCMIFFFTQSSNRRYTRCLTPFLFIARKQNFKQICEGVVQSIYRTRRIYGWLTVILLIWGYAGYCMFFNSYKDDAKVESTAFNTLTHAIYTSFHCFLSRPSVLYRLQALTSSVNTTNRFMSYVYFVSLTLIADILMGSLIIATGTRYFRDYSSLNFRRRLGYRNEMLRHIFALISTHGRYKPSHVNDKQDEQEEEDLLSIENFVRFAQSLKTGPIYDEIHARELFCTEDNRNKLQEEKHGNISERRQMASGYVNSRQFFRLAGALSAELIFRDGNRDKDESLLMTVDMANRSSAYNNTIEQSSFQDTSNNINESDDYLSYENEDYHETVTMNDATKHNVSVENPLQAFRKQSSDKNVFGRVKGFDSIESVNQSTSSQLNSKQVNDSTKLLTFNTSRISNLSIRATYTSFQEQMTSWYVFLMSQFTLSFVYITWIKASAAMNYTYITIHYYLPQLLRKKNQGNNKNTEDHGNRLFIVRVIDIVSIMMHIVLLAIMVILTSNRPTYASYCVNWFLWAYFTCETIVRSFALDVSQLYIRNNNFINLFNFILLCMLRLPDHSDLANQVKISFYMNQVVLTFLIIIQSLRFLKFIRLLPGAESLLSIAPIISRIILLLAFVIYFFGTLGHVSLCDTLDSSSIAYVSDDDSQSWIKYSSFLNLSGYLQSMYTLFQVALLSNWSIIMDAATVSSAVLDQDKPVRLATKASIIIFFFVFRAVMVLIFMPSLMSFVIQSFIQQLRRSDKEGTMLGPFGNSGGKSLQIYRISAKAIHQSVLVSIWSSDGKETVPRPVKQIQQRSEIIKLENRLKSIKQDLHIIQSYVFQLLNNLLILRKTKLSRDIEKGLITMEGKNHENDINITDNEQRDQELGLFPSSLIFEITESNLYIEQVAWSDLLRDHLSILLKQYFKRLQLLQVDTNMNMNGIQQDETRRTTLFLGNYLRSWGSSFHQNTISRSLPDINQADRIHSNNNTKQNELQTINKSMKLSIETNLSTDLSSKALTDKLNITIFGKSNDEVLDPNRDSIISLENYNEREMTNELKQENDSFSVLLNILPNHIRDRLPEFMKHASDEEKSKVAALWLEDAIKGRKIGLSLKKRFIQFYEIARSPILSYYIYFALIVHIILSFFSQPLCVHDPDSTINIKFIGNHVLSIMDAIFMPVYLAEVAVDGYVGIYNRRPNTLKYISSWTTNRTIILFLIFIDSIVYLSTPKQSCTIITCGRTSRSLFPWLIMFRDDSLRTILSGLFHSFRKSRLIYMLLGGILLYWSMLGFFLFQRVETSTAYNDRFHTWPKSFATILQCSTSAPYSLFVVVPYVESFSKGSVFFFLLVTLTTELLVINLIVAVGNAALMKFAEKTIRSRLAFRLVAVLACWTLFSEVNNEQSQNHSIGQDTDTIQAIVNLGRMSFDKWLLFCSGLKGTMKIDSITAKYLYLYVLFQRSKSSENKPIDKHSIENPLINNSFDDSKTVMETLVNRMIRESNGLDIGIRNDTSVMFIDGKYPSIGLLEFIRLVSLLSLHAKVEVFQSTIRSGNMPMMIDQSNKNVIHTDEVSSPHREIINDDTSSTENEQSNHSKDNEIISSVNQKTIEPLLPMDQGRIDHYDRRKSSRPPPLKIISNSNHSELSIHQSAYVDIHTELIFSPNLPLLTSDVSYTINQNNVPKIEQQNNIKVISSNRLPAIEQRVRIFAHEKSNSFIYYENVLFPLYFEKLVLFCRYILSLQITINVPSVNWFNMIHINQQNQQQINNHHSIIQYDKINVLLVRITGILARILLIIAVVYTTNGSRSGYHWLIVSWILEGYFWIEMIMYMIALGEIAFLRNIPHALSLVTNIISIILLIVIGTYHHGIQPGGDSVVNNSLEVYIMTQCIRLISVVWHPSRNIQAQLNSSMTNFRYGMILVAISYLRILFILGSMIYFYTVIAQQLYCGIMTYTTVSQNSNEDDDSSSWLRFSTILNFDTYWQSYFTLFQVMILGSWSMVMDAAAKVEFLGPYFFFFIYRLGATLIFLPLLISFVIRAFIMAEDYEQQQKLDNIQSQSSSESEPDSIEINHTNTPMKNRHKQWNITNSVKMIQGNFMNQIEIMKPDNYMDTFLGMWALDRNSASQIGGYIGIGSHESRMISVLSIEIENLESSLKYYQRLMNVLNDIKRKYS